MKLIRAFFLLIALSALLISCKQEVSDTINSIDDAKNVRIAVMLGTTGEQIAINKFPDAEILSFDNHSDLVTALITDKTDAIIDAEPSMKLALKSNPSLKILPAKLNHEDAAVAVSKEDEELLSQVNQIITNLKAERFFIENEELWFYSDQAYPASHTPAFDENKEPLIIGVSAESEPFCFMNENQEMIGFEVDFAKRIGEELKRPIIFKNMFFGSLLAALKSGKIDLIICNMTPTEERKKQVNFTQPYFQQSQVMAVKGENQHSSKESFLSSFTESFHSNIIKENRYLLIWDGLKTTVLISILSALLGTILGAVVCFLRMSKSTPINFIGKVYIAVLRGTPVLVLLMIIFYVVFASVNINPVIVAVIAFGLNFAAYVSEMFRTGIEGVKKGQVEAGIALGFSRLRTFTYIVLPQAIKTILPVYKGELISMVKMTSVVGYIAVQDLTKASDLIRSRTFDAFFPLIMVTILYFIISWGLLLSLGHLEKISDPKSRRKKNKIQQRNT